MAAEISVVSDIKITSSALRFLWLQKLCCLPLNYDTIVLQPRYEITMYCKKLHEPQVPFFKFVVVLKGVRPWI